MVNRGWNVSFITYGKGSDLKFGKQLCGIDVYCNYLGLPPKLYEKFLILIHRRLFKNCDLIKTNQMYGSEIAVKIAKYYNKPIINRMGYLLSDAVETLPEFSHFDLNKIYKMQDFVFNQASKIVVTTNRIANSIINMNPLFKDKTQVIPNYVDTLLFSPKNEKKLYDILFIGRFSHQKNILNFLESVKDMCINILFIGNGSLENQIRESAKNSNNNFKWISSVKNNDIPRYMNQSKMFVLPSYYEGHPKILIEAMSCEMLVLASDVNGNNSIIKDGDNGFLCGTDSESIRAAIDSIFKMENEKLNKIKSRARNYVIQKFSLDKILELELNLYDEVLNIG